MSNMPMRTSILLLLASATLTACFPPPPGSGGGGGPEGVFEPATFASGVQPALDRVGCLTGCHNRSTGILMGGFGLNPQAAAGSDLLEENVELVVARINTKLSPDRAKDAKFYVKTTDGHGATLKFTDANDLRNLENWIIVGLGGTPTGGGGGGPDAGPGGGPDAGGGGGGADAFDASMYAAQIQPVLDNVGCINSGCHDIKGSMLGGDFGLTKLARANTPELTANIEAIVMRIDTSLDPSAADTAEFYRKATDRHAGVSITDVTALSNLENWIADGLTNQ